MSSGNKQASSTHFSFLINAIILGKHAANVKHILLNTFVKVVCQTRRKMLMVNGRQFSFVQRFIKGVQGNLIPEHAIAYFNRALRELIYIFFYLQTNMTHDRRPTTDDPRPNHPRPTHPHDLASPTNYKAGLKQV